MAKMSCVTLGRPVSNCAHPRSPVTVSAKSRSHGPRLVRMLNRWNCSFITTIC